MEFWKNIDILGLRIVLLAISPYCPTTIQLKVNIKKVNVVQVVHNIYIYCICMQCWQGTFRIGCRSESLREKRIRKC